METLSRWFEIFQKESSDHNVDLKFTVKVIIALIFVSLSQIHISALYEASVIAYDITKSVLVILGIVIFFDAMVKKVIYYNKRRDKFIMSVIDRMRIDLISTKSDLESLTNTITFFYQENGKQVVFSKTIRKSIDENIDINRIVEDGSIESKVIYTSGTDKNITVTSLSSGSESTFIKKHHHQVDELIYVSRGSIKVNIENEVKYVSEDESLTIPKSVPHSVEMSAETKIIVTWFSQVNP